MTKKFIPQQKNVNKHSLHGLRLLEKSVQSDGWIGAQTAAADGEMIAGSARLELAADKFADVEPIVVESDGSRPVVIVRTDIQSADDPRAKRLSVADNQISHTDWNPDGDLLAEWGEDEAIRAMFADSEWQEITGEEKPTKDAAPQVDRAAELLDKWQVKTGDLWQIGEHRLICGDCTDAATVERVMMGEKADITFTDPPYGVGLEYGMHEDNPEENESLVIRAFSFGPDSKIWTPGLKNLARELIREPHAGILAWNRKFSVGWPPHGCSWATVWEPVLVTKPKCRKLKTDHFEYMTDTFKVGDTKLTELHPCPKAIGLWTELLEGLSEQGMVIYEPFSGSGTTILACENLGRKARAIELDPAYVAVALERMSAAFPELEIKRL
jgi:hypothetical protein